MRRALMLSIAITLAGCAGPMVYQGRYGTVVCTSSNPATCEQLERSLDELHTPDMERRIQEARR